MKDYLTEQLDRTNYWLSFSEAKNGALMALNVAIIAACTKISMIPFFTQVLICIFFLIPTVLCLISFLPNLSSTYKSKYNENTSDNDLDLNLTFYGDIIKLKDANNYLSYVKNKYHLTEKESEKNLCIDLASEIMINSMIAKEKYSLFKKAIFIDIFAIFIFIIGLILA